jgi:phage tail sheath protein FI
MAETFLHGVEVLEIDAGPRPIQTVRSSVIGLIGTAPGATPDVKATLLTGVVASNNALTITSKLAGALGNAISLELVNPGTNSASLAITVTGQAIRASLATSSGGAITTTAAQLKTAIEASTAANALVAVANTSTSTGAGAVAALAATSLSGGVDEPFPLNTPVLVAGSLREAAKLGTTGTLPDAMDSIFDQAGAVVVVVRVAAGANETATLANIVGGVNSTTGEFEGVQCFLGAESKLGVTPRILLAPGWTHQRPDSAANPVVAELIGIAERLRAIIVADGPNTTDEAAVAYAGDFGSPRVYMVDPGVKKLDSAGNTADAWASACVAGIIAKTDNDLGFWWSPSNKTVNGILGTKRAVDFALGDANARANLLNEQGIATIIRQDGYRLWGNRTLSSDPKWIFLSVRRTADIINDSLLRAHLWAVDRNITKSYITDVTEGVNAYLRHLVAIGAILGGKCWADPDLNTPDQIAQGKVYFNFDFTPPFPAEHITFRSQMVNDYLTELFA